MCIVVLLSCPVLSFNIITVTTEALWLPKSLATPSTACSTVCSGSQQRTHYIVTGPIWRESTSPRWIPPHGPLARYVKLRFAHAPGMPGTFSPSLQVGDPGMHHGTCVTHVPWCMSGSLTSSFLWNRRRAKPFPSFPAHAQPAILRIW